MILLVEDDLDIRELVTEILIEEGFSVIAVADGAQAIALTKTITPCLILTDLMMPGMSGWDFINFLDKNKIWEQVPTVAMTADGTDAKFKRHVAFLKKPVHIEDVLRVCHKHCRG